ncbi:hypothetical protein CU074_07570 [Klebsiella pneumoniae]|nr:hypothetical protein CU074_07570 [Klebsiella pneumoniae]
MTAQIILKDENGNFATIDNLSDWDLFRLINITRLAEKTGGIVILLQLGYVDNTPMVSIEVSLQH